MKKITLEDFESVPVPGVPPVNYLRYRPEDMAIEICIEPLFGGVYHVALYNRELWLIGAKQKAKSINKAIAAANKMIEDHRGK